MRSDCFSLRFRLDLLATIQARFQAQQVAGLLRYLRNIIHGAGIGCKLLTSKPYITILHNLVMIDSGEDVGRRVYEWTHCHFS